MELNRANWIVSERPVLQLLQGQGKPALSETEHARKLDFDQLFRQYAPYVGTIALHVLGSFSETDDVVQEVFLVAHRKLDQLRDTEAIKGWLAKITIRCARRHLRRAWWQRVISPGTNIDFDELAAAEASPEERTHVASAYRLLARMPIEERLVWVLRHIQEEPLEQIAELVGCSLSTVQRRLRRAQATMEAIAHD